MACFELTITQNGMLKSANIEIIIRTRLLTNMGNNMFSGVSGA